MPTATRCPESRRLADDDSRRADWKRWGPYLPERQWGTVREDYSRDGDCWNSFPHDDARSRAYRWGEDGILGFTDRQCRLCFAPAFWNGQDPILKERFFGLTNEEGNHGEDVKEAYFYLDATPTHSYQKALYKYPQTAYPYDELVAVNKARSRQEPEYEITDTAAFADNRYFDLTVEYAKAAPEDILIQFTITNHGPDSAPLHLLPTLWFRNTWAWGPQTDESTERPILSASAEDAMLAEHETLGDFLLLVDRSPDGSAPEFLFTENETNHERLHGIPNGHSFVKDAFDQCLVHDRADAVNPEKTGTKAAAWHRLKVASGETQIIRLRLVRKELVPAAGRGFGATFEALFQQRREEADAFFQQQIPFPPESQEFRVMRQAQAGLLWSKQFYNYQIRRWKAGDPGQPVPDRAGPVRNAEWRHLFNRDILSIPDKWEYPWYAAWDLAFHTVELARVDQAFAKGQLQLLLREWYMHPNGQIPAYEFAFSDTNPPVHAWAAWRVYKITGERGHRDTDFLESVFQKLLINFTWWVNQVDTSGRNLFAGGFLGLDNIGVFDRSRKMEDGHSLEQADGTAWMAFYCLNMLEIALELAQTNPAYEDIASKFFEHFTAITEAINTLGGSGLWDETDGFYYDQITTATGSQPLKIRSIVGLMPLIAVSILPAALTDRLKGFGKRVRWFLRNRPGMEHHTCTGGSPETPDHPDRILSVPSREKLVRMLGYLLDESEFLSDFGIRSLSAYHRDHPYRTTCGGGDMEVEYDPGESTSALFGGNSNWRGPVWLPINHLLIESLERYHHFYGGSLTVEFPTGSGQAWDLGDIAGFLRERLNRLFLPDADDLRPAHQSLGDYANDPLWRGQVLFHEYFHGDTGSGLGASHQTGWTALIADSLRSTARRPECGPGHDAKAVL